MNDHQDNTLPLETGIRPATALGDPAGHAVDEPWASGQRKRYLASLDTQPKIV